MAVKNIRMAQLHDGMGPVLHESKAFVSCWNRLVYIRVEETDMFRQIVFERETLLA